MADLTTLQTRLTEAETALDRLRKGEHVAATSFGSTRVQFTEPTDLERYIADLQAQIDALQNTRPRRGPIYLEF